MIQVVQNINEVIPNLWFGGKPNSDQVKSFRFIFGLNGKPGYQVPEHTFCTLYEFDDTNYLPPEEDLRDLAIMALLRSRQGPTLVHCSAGLNRSALVTALALMYNGMTAVDAIDLLRRKRSDQVLFNYKFQDWLLQATAVL